AGIVQLAYFLYIRNAHATLIHGQGCRGRSEPGFRNQHELHISYTVLHKLIQVEVHLVEGLVLDPVPQILEVRTQDDLLAWRGGVFIVGLLYIKAARNFLQDMLHSRFDSIELVRQLKQVMLERGLERILHLATFIDKAFLLEKIKQLLGLLYAQIAEFALIIADRNAGKAVLLDHTKAYTLVFLNFFLERAGKFRIGLVGHHCQGVDGITIVSDPLTTLVYRKAQTTADFLTFFDRRSRLVERTNLEYVGVIPAFTQCGVGKDKAQRRLHAQQALFVLHNQIVCGLIIGSFTAGILGHPLAVGGKVAIMHSSYMGVPVQLA